MADRAAVDASPLILLARAGLIQAWDLGPGESAVDTALALVGE